MPKEQATKTTTLAEVQNSEKTKMSGEMGIGSMQQFENLLRVSEFISKSDIIPKEFKGNVSNCLIALNMANRMDADPLMVMQNLYIIYGKPSWSSQFMIATFNKCGRYDSIQYQFFGTPFNDDFGCRALTREKGRKNKIVGTLVTIGLAKKEGWYSKSGSKWQTMPEQMLRYRAASWLIRTTAPEISMGLHTKDEVEDGIMDADYQITDLGEAMEDYQDTQEGEKTDG